MSLKIKTTTAVFWSGIDVLMRQGFKFIVAIFLARLLSPEEFGTIALLYLFTGIAGAFIDGGFSAALIQRKDTTLTDESTVFWINLAMGILFSVLLWACAPLFAAFFGFPILIPLTGVLAMSLLINALGAIHITLLTKKLDFKTPMKIGVVSSAASGLLAIGMAFNDYGVWALAAQTVTASAISTTLLWVSNAWRPRFEFSLDSARRLFRFGSYLMLSGLLDIAYNRFYTLLIGKFYGVRELGFYTRADNTKQIPVDVLSDTLARVIFPVFSVAADDKEKLKRGVMLALRTTMFINVPVMLGLIATADNVVLVLFGAQWMPAVPMLRVLCLAGMLWPLHVINLNVLKAQGHSHLFFRLEVIKKVIGFAFLILGFQFGVMGIAWSQTVIGVVSFFINAFYTGKYLDYGALKQSSNFMPIILIAAVVATLAYLAGVYFTLPPYQELIIQVMLGFVLFIAICFFCRLQAFIDFYNVILNKYN